MNLYLDIGNSRIKWKMDGMPSARVAEDLGALAEQWQAVSVQKLETLSGCCVRGQKMMQDLDRLALRVFGRAFAWRSSLARACGVSNAYPEPARLGVDRWVAMLAARARCPDKPCIVVDAGTAITVDLLDARGQHLGGTILPGARTMLDTLDKAEQLFPDAGRDLHRLALNASPLADNTQDAVLGGVVHAVQGGVHSVILQQAAQIGAKIESLSIIVTGGDAPMLKLDTLNAHVVPDLVLEGLKVWMECER